MPYDVDIGDGADALGQNQLSDALDGTYWVSGWDATLGTGDLEVDIAAGEGAVAGTDVSTGSTQTIDFTGDPDSTDPRKAVIYVDATGTVQKALGTPQPVDPGGEIRFRTYNPSPPASVSGVVVAEVWLAAGETVLESADVRDRRVSNDAVEGVAPGIWSPESNSPTTASNTDTVSAPISDDFDFYRISYTVSNGSSFDQIHLRLNGDAGSEYQYYTLALGNTSASSVLVGGVSGGEAQTGEISIIDQDGGFSYTNEDPATRASNTITTDQFATFGVYTGGSSPLTSVELTTTPGSSTAFDWEVQVLGRDVE